MLVGISGRICAGKTTAARMLEQTGFAYTRISLVIDAEIRRVGGVLDRATRQRVGMELHDSRGQEWLCEQAVHLIDESHQDIVVDGLRFPEDCAYFASRYGESFVHLHLVTDALLRAERCSRAGEATDLAVADAQPVEQHIDQIGALATATIDNNGAMMALEQAIGDVIRRSQKREDA